MNDAAMEEARQAPDGHEKAFMMIVCAKTYQQLLQRRLGSRDALYTSATNAYNAAIQVARNIGDDRASTYALGGLGGLYEQDARYGEALELTRRAAFLAQKTRRHRGALPVGMANRALAQGARSDRGSHRRLPPRHPVPAAHSQ